MEETKGASRLDGYTKAGLFGLPFCIIGYLVRGEAIYLLAGGFFAGLLGSPLIKLFRGSRSSVLERNMSEDYGMKSFNGIVFAVLGLMALILIGAIVFIKAGRPKHASQPTTTQSSPSRQPQ